MSEDECGSVLFEMASYSLLDTFDAQTRLAQSFGSCVICGLRSLGGMSVLI